MKKRALLVGINYVGTSSELRGCINDCNNMKTMLESKGFTEIKLILEKEATTTGIIDGLNWLISDTRPGDVIVFHFSGHGSQLPCSEEADLLEEIICPIDLNWKDKVINDKTLKNIFNRVPRGVNTTVILDCCHSGTMLNQIESLEEQPVVSISTRDFRDQDESRYLPAPESVESQLKGRTLTDWHASRDINSSALLIATCQANQTAADAFIDGQFQGAGTAAMLKSIYAKKDISYRMLVTEMRDYMRSNRFRQTPDLDGSSMLYDRTFLEEFAPSIPQTETIIVSVADQVIAVESSITEVSSTVVRPSPKAIIFGIVVLLVIFAVILA